MASVLVHGEFDPLTQRTFRKLQSNQSVFTERSITNLERAVAVTAAVGRGDNTRWGNNRGNREINTGSAFNRFRGQRGTYRSMPVMISWIVCIISLLAYGHIVHGIELWSRPQQQLLSRLFSTSHGIASSNIANEGRPQQFGVSGEDSHPPVAPNRLDFRLQLLRPSYCQWLGHAKGPPPISSPNLRLCADCAIASPVSGAALVGNLTRFIWAVWKLQEEFT